MKKERVDARLKDIVITAEMVTERSKKISNWKVPGPDGVQGYWIKNLTAIHERMADHNLERFFDQQQSLYGRQLEELCSDRKIRNGVVRLLTINPYPVYHLLEN